MKLHGPRISRDGVTFRVWAPQRERVELVLYDDARREHARVPMTRDDAGVHEVHVASASVGALYAFLVDGEGPFPDPASRAQPFGVHGPSRVVDPGAFRFEHAFGGRSLEELVLYEVHVGTATREGTFRALIERLDTIASLGVTAIELLPIADFPGERNWGYDGVAPFAPARCYGTPEDLVALIDAAHARGLAVLLDVVYNHLGPDGNYLRVYSHSYFTDRHTTPWGDALDYDGPRSRAVRAFVLENVAQWIGDYRFDGLRLDATHAIIDSGALHLLTEIAETARAAAGDRRVVVIAEDERNDAKMVMDPSLGGRGLSAVWADDFHHEVRRIIGGDDEGYFADFRGTLDELVEILRDGWLYQGQPSRVHGAGRGTPIAHVAPEHLVYCIQNHDQIGNRALGERLHHSVDLARVRAATALLLAVPYTPMLFAGQEFAASSPWPYFTHHNDELGRLVTEGRRREFSSFRAFADEANREKIPDPQAPSTFAAAKLDWSELDRSPGREMFELHRALIKLRNEEPAMQNRARPSFQVHRHDELLVITRRPLDLAHPELVFVIGLTAGGSVPIDRGASGFEVVLDTEAPFGNAAEVGSDGVTLRGAGAVVVRRQPAAT